MAEHQLKELAYAIFLSCCGGRASRGLLADLRASLELSEARAEELARILALVGRHGVTSLGTLEAHVKLLQASLFLERMFFFQGLHIEEGVWLIRCARCVE